MKKRILAMLMAVVMLLTIVGCGNSAAESYKTMAQGFIDDGNIESAKKTLEDGIAETKNKELQAMLDGLSDADLSDYDGTWAEEDLSYENGGMILRVATNEGATMLSFEYAEESIGFTDGPLDHSILKNEVNGSTITITKAMDIYENLVDMTISFGDDTVTCNITNVEDAGVSPLLKKGTYTLVRNEDAYTVLAETPWSDAMGVKADGFTEEPFYDTSKASGILAQAGLTEEEFRAKCIPLHESGFSSYSFADQTNSLIDIDRYDLAIGKQYFAENPHDDGVSKGQEMWGKICDDYKQAKHAWDYTTNMQYSTNIHYYEKYQNEDNYLNEQVYARTGHKKIYENTAELFKQIKEYPSNYVGQCFVLLDAPTSLYTDNYANAVISINDLRDDPNNPNIISNYKYYFYVIFAGTHKNYNDIVLDFNLISLEKIGE